MGLKKFFDDWNHQYQLEIIDVYHKVQNENKHKESVSNAIVLKPLA